MTVFKTVAFNHSATSPRQFWLAKNILDGDVDVHGWVISKKRGPLKQAALFNIMVEREGFEPSIRVSPYTHLAGVRFQPLSHLSVSKLASPKVGAWEVNRISPPPQGLRRTAFALCYQSFCALINYFLRERGPASRSARRRLGFEPSIRVSPYTHLAGVRFQPLSHLSVSKIAPKRSRTSNLQIRSLTLYPIELWAHIIPVQTKGVVYSIFPKA